MQKRKEIHDAARNQFARAENTTPEVMRSRITAVALLMKTRLSSEWTPTESYTMHKPIDTHIAIWGQTPCHRVGDICVTVRIYFITSSAAESLHARRCEPGLPCSAAILASAIPPAGDLECATNTPPSQSLRYGIQKITCWDFWRQFSALH